MIQNFVKKKNLLQIVCMRFTELIDKINVLCQCYSLERKRITTSDPIKLHIYKNKTKEVDELPTNKLLNNCYHDIIVHEKYKVQVALCVDRFPLNFVQEEFEKQFQNFKDEWLLKTKNNLEIVDEFLHMKYNLSSFNEKEKNEKDKFTEGITISSNSSIDRNVSMEEESIETENGKGELEELLSLEGINQNLREKKKRKKDYATKEKEEAKKDTDESDYKNIKRKPNDFLYLVVKYRNSEKWVFPFIDYSKSFTIRQMLQHLWKEQIESELPFFIGYCPCTFEKRRFTKPLLPNEIIGRKIFYYRAHYINLENNFKNIQNKYISDFAWITRSELPKFLSKKKFLVIKDALPLT